jgi:UrcA family protein
MPASRLLIALAVSSPLMAVSAPAAAQAAPEEIIVTGELGEVPDNVQSLSQAVSYADLDLSTDAGRDMLRHRVRLTARYLCDRLGENDASSPLIPSCRDAAVRDAMQRVGTVEANFAPRGTTWVAPAAWAPPYPESWYTEYPYEPETVSQPVGQSDSSPRYVSEPVIQQTAPADYTGERG